MGNREIKLSNKTKEKLVEGFSIRLITPSRACEQSKKLKQIRQILKPNQDQSVAPVLAGDFANCELPYFSKSKSLGQGLSTLRNCFLLAI